MSAYRISALAGAAALASLLLLGSGPASAFVCAGAFGSSDGGVADSYFRTACGNNAIATGNESSAFGQDAEATGLNASALGEAAHATGDESSAFGQGAVADHTNASAFGEFARAQGDASSAFGQNSWATATGASAIGWGAHAFGANSTAVGFNASAVPDNSAAFGAGATATRPEQQMFGTPGNTYTMAGIASTASTAAQTGVGMGVVTSDSSGNLAVDTGLYSQIGQDQQGVAMAMALSDFWVPTGKKMAIGVNMGTWDGSWALGTNIGGQIGDGAYLTGGIAVSQTGMVAGRAGGVFAW